MKGKTTFFIYYLLLSMLMLAGGSDFVDATGLIFNDRYKFKIEKEYALTDKISLAPEPFPQTNNRPIVKILAPKDKSSYPLGTRVAYQISVSDPEDGESKYGEITQNEVLLKVEYIESTGIPIEDNKTVEAESGGLTGILKSNCLNCHAFKGNLIGPSFYEISNLYTPSEHNLETLEGKIKEGSSGVWGNTVMPSHPELSSEEIQEMVQWILENTGKANITYYTGTESSISLPSPGQLKENTAFMLTASYTDQGVGGGQKLKGQDSIIIYSK